MINQYICTYINHYGLYRWLANSNFYKPLYTLAVKVNACLIAHDIFIWSSSWKKGLPSIICPNIVKIPKEAKPKITIMTFRLKNPKVTNIIDTCTARKCSNLLI